MGRFCPPSNLQVAVMMASPSPPDGRIEACESGERGGEFFCGPIKRYSLCAIAATATRRNHSRLPAPLSPLPKQTERATRANGTRTRENGPPCKLHLLRCLSSQPLDKIKYIDCVCRFAQAIHGRRCLLRLPAVESRGPNSRSLPSFAASLPLPLAFIGRANE